MAVRTAASSKLRVAAARLGNLRTDEGGNVIIYVTVASALLLGIVGLALDSSRAMITHSEAQAAADAAALAAASQLDGQSGACANAKTEASAVANRQRFAQGGGANITIASGSPVCLSNLPSSDSAATTGFVTTNDAASRYVQVTTQQLTHQNTFLAALTSNNTATIQRTAVAGFRRSLCAGAPVMSACTPFSWTSGVAFDAWDATGNGPFKGWLNANDCNNANCVHDELAGIDPAFCVVDNSLQPATGNKTNKAADGINTRFGQKSTTDEPSDRNIVDFTAYSTDINGVPNSTWNCAGYWAARHGGAAPAGCSDASHTTMTRYSMYQLERAGTIPAANQPKAGTPTPSPDRERRIVYLAAFDCGSSAAPAFFLKAFLIAPAQAGSVFTAYVEAIGLATSKTDPTAIHEEVQLYR